MYIQGWIRRLRLEPPSQPLLKDKGVLVRNMKTYPLTGAYPREGEHTVEVTLQSDDCIGSITFKIQGNKMGANILKTAIDHIVDFWEKEIVLTSPDGQSLIIDPNEATEEEIAMAVVGVKIINYEGRDWTGKKYSSCMGKKEEPI